MSVYWLNGRLVTAEQAVVPVTDHGLLYGDGVFEGIRFYHGVPFMLDAHLHRLTESAAALALSMPYSHDELKQAVHECITAFDHARGYLRLVVTRGTGALGVDTAGCHTPNTFIICDQLTTPQTSETHRGLRAVIVSTRKIPSVCFDSRIKSLNYLTQVLARMQARHAGADEAIMLNQAGQVAEGAINNVFVVKAGVLHTPPVTEGALDGITRRLVLHLAGQSGIQALETPLNPFDLYTADECFLTGTGVELLPVSEVDGRSLANCPGTVFIRLQRAFQHYIAAVCGPGMLSNAKGVS